MASEPSKVVGEIGDPAAQDAAGYVLVLSDTDPVARAVAAHLGTPEATDVRVDGTPVRRLRPGVGLLHRPGPHIHDDALRVPPSEPGRAPPTLVFPSVHRSQSATPALTVHPLGNPGPTAPVGGQPRRLVPTDPGRMTDALRRVAEVGRRLGWPTSFEATHHGPALLQPAFFVEIGAVPYDAPPAEAVRGFVELLPELRGDARDLVAVGIGGGHYAPRFSELALARRWAFGHLLPRHALPELTAERVEEAFRATPGARGLLFQRLADVEVTPGAGGLPRLRESDAPPRERGPP